MFSNINTLLTALSVVIAKPVVDCNHGESSMTEECGLLFPDMVGQNVDTGANAGNAAFDTYIMQYMTLETQDEDDNNTVSNHIKESFRVEGDDENENIISEEQVLNVLKNYDAGVLDTMLFSEESGNVAELGCNDYDILKSLFYSADAYKNLLSNKEIKVASRFVDFFLRRYYKFTIMEMNRSNKAVAVEVDPEAPIKIDLLNIDERYNTLYFDSSFTLFSRLVTSPMYRETTVKFTEALLKEMSSLDELSADNITYNAYFSVLQAFITKMQTFSSQTTDKANNFINENKPLYVANLNIEYSSSTASKNCIQGVAVRIAADNIKTAEVVKHME